MKARRRHALKENVLAHELGEIKSFFSRYGNWVLAGVVAVVIVVLVVLYYQKLSKKRLADEAAEYERLARYANIEEDVRLNGLIELAETAKDPVVGAGSAVYVGDICSHKRLDALRRANHPAARDWRQKAERFYRLVIERYPERKLFQAKAHLGLGVLAEDGGELESARAAYEQARRSVNDAYPVAREAQRRLANLQAWSEPVRFATTTQASQPATGPSATQPASRPAKAPAGE